MDKVYTPEVVPENPFPGGVEPVIAQTPVTSGDYAPPITQATKLPKRRVAQELLSSALNTKSRKILQEFELAQTGGFKVGNYEEGITGDLRITPNGIVARDISGSTKFALDGNTGDAIFSGEIRSGSILSGDLTIDGGNIQVSGADGYTVIDGVGLISNSSSFNLTNNNGSPNQSITTTIQTDISGSSATFTVSRTIRFLLFLSSEMYLVESAGNTCNGEIGLNIDGSYPRCVIRLDSGSTSGQTYTNFFVGSFQQGSHTIKLQAKLRQIFAGSPSLTVRNFSWAYVLLGT